MLVFFFPFFENLGSYLYDSICMRARVRFCFWKASAHDAIFSLRSCTACARACSRCASACMHALARARAGPPTTAAPALSATRRQRRKVDKYVVWPIKSRPTNQQTCSRCACLPAPHARGRPRRLGCSRSTRRQRRKVDKCRVADKKQTNKHTLLFYRYRYIQNSNPLH